MKVGFSRYARAEVWKAWSFEALSTLGTKKYVSEAKERKNIRANAKSQTRRVLIDLLKSAHK
jgi:hypothetical protein